MPVAFTNCTRVRFSPHVPNFWCKVVCYPVFLFQWFPGKIAVVNDDYTYDIVYEDGDEEKNVSMSRIEVMVGSRARLFAATTLGNGRFKG